MRKQWKRRIPAALVLLLVLGTQAYALEAAELIPVGSTVGIRLELGGVMVAGLTEVRTEDGTACPAESAGLKSGDVITKIGEYDTPGAAEFLTAIRNLDGSEVELTVMRDGREVQFRVTPVCSTDGAYQMGLWLRDGLSGIGTVTFYDPASGVYGALGHGINNLQTGELTPFASGTLTASEVVDVIPGREGKPGELCGRPDDTHDLATVERNTPAGIFGTGDFGAYGDPIPVASEEEVKLGPASILANVEGNAVQEYAVEISRICRGDDDNRFFLLTVTDDALLQRTGGIVQGMSGSPVLQNGKLIGAVTHVLVKDPTRGYAISIREMLNAA